MINFLIFHSSKFGNITAVIKQLIPEDMISGRWNFQDLFFFALVLFTKPLAAFHF